MQKHNPAVHQRLPASPIPDKAYAGLAGRTLRHCFAPELGAGLLWLATLCALGSPAYGSFQSSTTSLSVSPASVAAGNAVTLTATVTANDPVTRGQVMFCAAAAAHCDGPALFGVAQLTTDSTAAIKLTLGAGSYSIKAIFSGITGTTGSTSAAHSLAVTGAANYASSTTIAATGSAGAYTLTGQVTFFGKAAATGTISFLDASHSNALVGSAPLDSSSLAATMTSAPGSPLTAQNAEFVVSGDFNHDGISDLAVLNDDSSGTVGIYLGKGNGTFQSRVDYSVGQFPIAMAVGDVDGDGNLDLIVANINDGTVSVLLGNGNGTFQGQTTFATGENPESVAVGDFNRDGRLDLAVANFSDSTVGILLGNGDGTFQAQVTYFVPNPQGIAVADFNHDGIVNLAVTGIAQGAILDILLGVGDGTFIPQMFIQLPGNAFGFRLAAGDLRNNGTQDVVVPDLSSANVYVFLGNNDGTFQAPVTYAVGASADQVVLGDVSGDGLLDLVVTATGGCGCGSAHAGGVAGICGCVGPQGDGLVRKGSRLAPGRPPGGELVSVLLGRGDGTFAAKTDYPVGNSLTTAALADLNGDGLLDIATSDIESNTATILLSARTETAAATGQAVYGTGVHNVLARYAGDVERASSQSTTVPLTTVPQVATSTVLAIAPNPAVLGQSVTLTATVSPAPTGSPLGTASFYNGTTLLGSGNVDSSGVATFTTTSLPAGSDILMAVYSGNEEFAVSSSVATTVAVNPVAPTYSITAPTAPVPVAPGAAVTITIMVPPLGGAFNNAVTLSASGLPPGATATFNPPTVTPGSAGGQSVMTIQLATLAAHHGGFPGAPFILASALLGGGLGRKRLSRTLLLVFLLATLGVTAGLLTGCNGGFASTLTPTGSYTVTVTGTSGTFHASTTVTLMVQ